MARIKIVERIKPNETTKPKKKIKKKKSSFKKPRERKKKKKEIIMTPRLQLEPTLTPKQDPKKLVKITEQSSPVDKNEAELDDPPKQVTLEEIMLPDISNFDGLAKAGPSSTKCKKPESIKIKYEIPEDEVDYKEFEAKRRPPKGSRIRGTHFWNDREVFSMAAGLQKYGFNETEKIAEMVKTRNGNEVSHFIKLRSMDARNSKNPVKHQKKGRPRDCWSKVSAAHLPTWPHVRKWRKLAHEQMLAHVRMKDYSKPVLNEVLEKFYDEEEECSDPQVINVKLIYKYLMDCMAGAMPAQLPPKESALMLDLLKDLRLVPLVCDFQEERTFLDKYRQATRYKPFELKDEFRKKLCRGNPDVSFNHNCVSVPDEVFLNLSRHKKMFQSFNPLVVPIWMMHKEQGILSTLI